MQFECFSTVTDLGFSSLFVLLLKEQCMQLKQAERDISHNNENQYCYALTPIELKFDIHPRKSLLYFICVPFATPTKLAKIGKLLRILILSLILYRNSHFVPSFLERESDGSDINSK